MSKRHPFLPAWPLVLLLTAFFLAEQLGHDTALFREVLTARRVAPFTHLVKLTAQLLGCLFAARSAALHEKGNPARAAWILVSIWLGSYFPAQAILAVYECALQRPPPVPSAADPFVLVGNACVVVALFRFIRVYRASGFPMGRLRDHLLVAAAACAVFVPLTYRTLEPILQAPLPLAERLVKVGYPVLDLVLFVPTLVLLRITVRFRGGRVWTVWAALLAGILFAAGGDVLFSDVSAENLRRLGALIDLLYVLSYVFCAYGARLEYELLTD